MRKEVNDLTNADKNDNKKTSPRGMAPDRAHASHTPDARRRNVETDETFDNSPQNAGSPKRGGTLK